MALFIGNCMTSDTYVNFIAVQGKEVVGLCSRNDKALAMREFPVKMDLNSWRLKLT